MRQNRRRSAEEAAALAAAAAAAKPTPPPPAASKSKAKAKAPAKPAAKARAWASEYQVGVQDLLGDTLIDNKAKTGSLTGDEAERVCIGIPLAAFSLQYVHSSDVYPLGRMGMLIGESDSCKTAYLFETMRWYLRDLGGGACYILNEARDPADLRSSIIGPELLQGGRFKLEGPCQSLEEWQRGTTRLLQRFEAKFKDTGGCAFPLNLGLDSITGTTNERVIAAIDENGCASIGYGHDANLINIYSKYLFQRLYQWPVSFTVTSHIKFGTDKYNNKVMKIPGGDALRYVSTYITFLKKIKDIDRQDVAGGRRIEMKMMKSMGDHRTISVDFTWIFDGGTQFSTWDWHGATVELLAGFTGAMRKEVDDLVTFPSYNKTGKTTACPEAGFRKPAPWDEVGKGIMETPKLLRALQDLFGVKRRRAFQANVPYNVQIQQAIEAGAVELHDMKDAEGVEPEATEVEEGDAVLPAP